MISIVSNPRIRFGKPTIEDTRITVESVLELISEGLSFEQIVKDYYPDLKKEDIQACVRYAVALAAVESMS
ncbi:MAG: DUF433 domain-containing protein [Chloroflexi bacterium]|nr:DUF433 domain-containing protein [Chloroflexota bacterium]